MAHYAEVQDIYASKRVESYGPNYTNVKTDIQISLSASDLSILSDIEPGMTIEIRPAGEKN